MPSLDPALAILGERLNTHLAVIILELSTQQHSIKMSGIEIHTQDPINLAEATGETPQTAYTSKPQTSSQPSATTAPSNSYPAAQPGAARSTPTSTVAPSSAHGPPPPQPGAAPVPAPPATTAKATLPPPPKAGERPMPPEYYAPPQPSFAQPAHSQPYPSQMSQPPPGHPAYGVPPGSTTSATTIPSYTHHAPSTSLPISGELPGRTSLEHPPGYVQNPYASDMTPAQRLAAEQRENESESISPSLGYNDGARRSSNADFGEEDSVWQMAKKGLKKTGEEASKLHGRIWDSLEEK